MSAVSVLSNMAQNTHQILSLTTYDLLKEWLDVVQVSCLVWFVFVCFVLLFSECVRCCWGRKAGVLFCARLDNSKSSSRTPNVRQSLATIS
jgi:hypothetical protein